MNVTTSTPVPIEEIALNAVIFFFFGCLVFLIIVSVVCFGNMNKRGCLYTCLKFFKLKFLTLCCCCCYKQSKRNTEELNRDIEELKDLVIAEDEELL